MKDYYIIMNNIFEMQEEYAKKNNIPIMQKDAIEYIVSFLKERKIQSVLEIGTAICYSTLKMANVVKEVTSIERDEKRYNKAKEYALMSNLNNITLILSDALDIELKDKFDFILIDAAKAQNIKFINKFKSNLKEEGYIFIDNVDFHGLVGKSNEIKSRNLRGLVRKIEEFLKYLEEQNEFKVTKINKGDGLIMLEVKTND